MGRTPKVPPVTSPFRASSQARLSRQQVVSQPNFAGTDAPEVLSDRPLLPGEDRLLKLFEWFQKKNYQCWPKQAWIAAKLSCSVGSVRRWLAELVSRGFIKTISRGPLSSVYILVEKAVNAFRSASTERPLLQSAPYCMNCNTSNRLAEPIPRKPPTVEKTLLDKTDPEYVQEFARTMKRILCPLIERLAAAGASTGLPADVAGQLARSIDLQPRWRSPHSSIRNPLAYRLAVIEKELLGIRRIA